MAYLPLSLGEGEGERKITLNFQVVLCKSSFSGIIGMKFLVKPDIVASLVHLKVIYHGDTVKPVVLNTNLKQERSIHEVILKNLLTSSVVLEEGSGRVNMIHVTCVNVTRWEN